MNHQLSQYANEVIGILWLIYATRVKDRTLSRLAIVLAIISFVLALMSSIARLILTN